MRRVLLTVLLTLGTGASALTLPIERVLSGHVGSTTGAALAPDGRHLALIGRSAVYVTDLSNGRQTALSGHIGVVTGTVYAPDARTLFTSGSDGTVRRWNTVTGQRLSTLQACGLTGDAANVHSWASSLAVRSASDFTVSCAGSVQVWRGGQLVRTLPGELTAYSPDGTRLAVSNGDQPIRLYDAQTFTLEAEFALPKLAHPVDVFPTPGPPSALAFSPDGTRLAAAFSDSAPKAENFGAAVYDTGSGQLMFELGGVPDFVQGLAYSPDGQTLAATGRSSAKLYDAKTGRELRRLQPPNTRIGVNAVAWTPDGQQVIATSTLQHTQGRGGAGPLRPDAADLHRSGRSGARPRLEPGGNGAGVRRHGRTNPPLEGERSPEPLASARRRRDWPARRQRPDLLPGRCPPRLRGTGRCPALLDAWRTAADQHRLEIQHRGPAAVLR